MVTGDTCAVVSQTVVSVNVDANLTIECDGGCSDCSSVSNCTSCTYSYGLLNGECLPCSNNCKTCDSSLSAC